MGGCQATTAESQLTDRMVTLFKGTENKNEKEVQEQ
jgi:hypothetical protein